MTRIGLSQRVERHERRGEIRESLDVRWHALLAEVGLTGLPLSMAMDPQTCLRDLGLSGVILTGGNDVASAPGARSAIPSRDRFEAKLIDGAIDMGLPILGVCRGMQMVNVHFGGSLISVGGHAGTRHHLSVGDTQVDVNSYHDHGVPKDGMASDFQIEASLSDGTIEAMRHQAHLISCIMWHPEREDKFSPSDICLLQQLFVESAP